MGTESTIDPQAVKCGAVVGVFLFAWLLIWLSFSREGQEYVGEQVGDMPGSGGCSGVGIGALLLLVLGGITALVIRAGFRPNSGMVPEQSTTDWPTALICGGGPFLLFAALAVFLLIAAAIGGGGREG